MKLKESIITYSLMVVMCVGVVVGSLFGSIGDIIANIITSLTAVVSALAVYIQMKKDTQITQTEFLLEFSKNFYFYDKALLLEEKIDRSFENGEVYKYTSEDYELLGDYMLWLDALASMIDNKTFRLQTINNLFNYRFFSVVNNPYIQEHYLLPTSSSYVQLFELCQIWTRHRKSESKDKTTWTRSIPCSQYMILSIKKYGGFKGFVNGIKRLQRCHPPHGGVDNP